MQSRSPGTSPKEPRRRTRRAVGTESVGGPVLELVAKDAKLRKAIAGDRDKLAAEAQRILDTKGPQTKPIYQKFDEVDGEIPVQKITNHLQDEVERLNKPVETGSTSAAMASLLSAAPAVLSALQRIADAGKRGNGHSTVKPVTLMAWLITLVTPPGGVVLDPFAGSGTTGVAAVQGGFRFVGFERETSYHEIASYRLEAANDNRSGE
jgi:DNA modification methylase